MQKLGWDVSENMLFGRWELAVADDIYIRNGKGTNIYPYRIRNAVSKKETSLGLAKFYSVNCHDWKEHTWNVNNFNIIKVFSMFKLFIFIYFLAV